jgi:K+-sensing histidine kinase KdpD
MNAIAMSLPRRMPSPIRKITPGIGYWTARDSSLAREYAEVFGVLGLITAIGWPLPISYHSFGHIYLLAVIALSLRVGRWPVLVAAVVSAVAWNYVFMPPRLSFSALHVEESLMLGTYFFAALCGGLLTARIREQQRYERQREQRATALFHLTRALAAARTLDEAAAAALRQADELFNARTALLLFAENGILAVHNSSSLTVGEHEREVAVWASQSRQPAGRFTEVFPMSQSMYVPLLCAEANLGLFVVRLPSEMVQLTSPQRDLIDGFAAQIALLVERELWHAAGEREKLLAESDRLHRTLLDSVSHELKTPLSVLRSATEKLETDDAKKRGSLTGEIRTATSRLEHLVANLLNQSRLESGVLKPQLDWCDVHDLVSAARRAVGEALHGRPFKVEIPPDMPLILADAALMEQVLANILLNGALHTPAGTPIRLSAGVEGADRKIFIAVSDSGPGVPPEMKDSIFQKFRRGRLARAGGVGLGLSIVRGFVLAQGGDVVTGTSAEGGACFTVQLPHKPHGLVPSDER